VDAPAGSPPPYLHLTLFGHAFGWTVVHGWVADGFPDGSAGGTADDIPTTRLRFHLADGSPVFTFSLRTYNGGFLPRTRWLADALRHHSNCMTRLYPLVPTWLIHSMGVGYYMPTNDILGAPRVLWTTLSVPGVRAWAPRRSQLSCHGVVAKPYLNHGTHFACTVRGGTAGRRTFVYRATHFPRFGRDGRL